MTLRPAGTIRLGEIDDSLVILLDVEVDNLIVPIHRLAALTSRRARYAPVYRRYAGTGGRWVDVQITPTLRRSRSGHALVLRLGRDEIYTVPVAGVLAVVRGVESSVTISQIVTRADQMSDSHSRQTALGGGGK